MTRARQWFHGILYYSGLWLVFRKWNRRRIAILMYHGIVERDLGTWTQVPAEAFRKQMQYIHDSCKPIALTHAVRVLRQKEPGPRCGVAVTFDDGFRSNEKLGYPVLKSLDIPATIFMTTSFVEKSGKWGALPWSDFIRLVIRRAQATHLDARELGLGIIDLTDSKSTSDATRSILGRLKSLDAAEKNRLLALIVDRAQPLMPLDPEGYYDPLDAEALQRLISGGLIEFGAHTLNHEILTRLPIEEASEEMWASKAKTQQLTGQPVRHFAYPNGMPSDYNTDLQRIASNHFDSAATTLSGLNSVGCNPYELKRIPIGNDTNMIEFKLCLSGTLEFFESFIQCLRPTLQNRIP